MNFADKIISIFSPGAAVKRAQHRKALEIIERGFEGAAKGRRTDGWRSGSGSANTESEPALATLRNRSRDLERNNPYARKSIKVFSNNVIGSGIRAKIDNPEAAALWKLWAEKKKHCHYNERLNFYGIQRQVMKAVVRDGECFVRKRRVKNGSGVPIQLQVCEADFIDSSKTTAYNRGEGFTIQGVEFDSRGKRVAYWMYDQHPSDSFAGMSTRVPASDVIHVYSEDRPGQVRGIPWFAAIILRLRDLDEYEDAILIHQKIAACYTVFVTDSSAASGITPVDDDDLPDRVEPGRITKIGPGQSISVATPPAATGHTDFTTTSLKAVAAGIGITYEAMTGDLSRVNFSSGRMGWLEFARESEDIQENIIIPQLCEDVFDWFVDAASMLRLIREDVSATWTPPRREMIDPVKETNGINALIRNGLSSWSEQVRGQGYDPDEVMSEIVTEQGKWDKLGIKLDCDPRLDYMAEPEPLPAPAPDSE